MTKDVFVETKITFFVELNLLLKFLKAERKPTATRKKINYCFVESMLFFFTNITQYGPKNLSPLKCTKWSGLSAIQTSVSHAISAMNFLNFALSKNAVT